MNQLRQDNGNQGGTPGEILRASSCLQSVALSGGNSLSRTAAMWGWGTSRSALYIYKMLSFNIFHTLSPLLLPLENPSLGRLQHVLSGLFRTFPVISGHLRSLKDS